MIADALCLGPEDLRINLERKKRGKNVICIRDYIGDNNNNENFGGSNRTLYPLNAYVVLTNSPSKPTTDTATHRTQTATRHYIMPTFLSVAELQQKRP